MDPEGGLKLCTCTLYIACNIMHIVPSRPPLEHSYREHDGLRVELHIALCF